MQTLRPINPHFGATLSSAMRAHRWDSATLALELGVGLDTIKSYRLGRRLPPAQRLVRIAELFGVTVDDLLTAPAPAPDEPESLMAPSIPPPPPPPGVSRLYTPLEAAERLRLTVRGVTKLVHEGHLKPHPKLKPMRFTEAELDRFVSEEV